MLHHTVRQIISFSVVGVIAAVVSVHSQQPSAQAALEAGISQARAGDFFRAVITLNDVVSQLAARPEESESLARAHAYQAWAYVGLEQMERAKASVLLALKANPRIAIAAGEFSPEVVSLFDTARRPTTESPEVTAQAADQAGRFQKAFLAYLKAFQSLPEPAPLGDEQRLRQRLVEVVAKLQTKPMIPPDARQHLTKAEGLLEADAALGHSGGAAVQEAAATELRKAVRIAPWWPDAAFKLASVMQKLQRFDEALVNLNLYKLATAMETRDAPPPAPLALAPAEIHIYWPKQARGGGKPKLLCDGRHVANLQNSRFVVLSAAPGSHTIKFHKTEVTLPFEAGTSHYLRVSAEGFPPRIVFRPVSAAEGAEEMRQRETSPNSPRNTLATECKPPGPSAARPRR